MHAVRHIAARLPGEYAMLPVIQNVAVANKHIHSPAMGPFILADAKPVSEKDDVEATLQSFRYAVSRGVYNACDVFASLSVKLSTAPQTAGRAAPAGDCWGLARCLFCPALWGTAPGATIKFIPKSSRQRNKRATSCRRF